jgi:hypothetical protein
MAQADLGTGAEYPPPEGGYFSTLLNWLGALTSLALIGGLSVWGYQLAVRDVSGVPVIVALEGPMRVAPDDPGGQLAAHQGLAVNAVAADGVAEAPADRLALAPPPTALTDEDLPGSRLAEATPPSADEVLAERDDPPTPVSPEAEALALADRLAEVAEPLSGTIQTPTPEVPLAEAPQVRVIPDSVPGVRLSPRPVPRPDIDLTARAVAMAVASGVGGPAIASIDVNPDSLPPGTRLVQLGAFESREIAVQEWDKVAERFDDYIEGRKRVIQRAESGGKTFYRLRVVGFDDISDARRFCAVLVAASANCIPVVTR